MFEGREQAGTGTGVFTGGQPRVRGAANTLRLGDNLHVAVVVAEIPDDRAAPLVPGLNYSYNVGLAPFDEGAAQAAKSSIPRRSTPDADLSPRGSCATSRSTAGRTRRSATTRASCPASRCRRRR